MGVGFKPLRMGPLSTKVPLCENVNILNDEKAYEDTQPETNNLDSSYALDHIFSNPNNLLVENNHVTITPPTTQTNPTPWIKTFLDPSPLASKNDPNHTNEFDTNIFTFN